MIYIDDASKKDVTEIRKLAEKTWLPTYSPILSTEQIQYMLDTIYDEASISRTMEEDEQHYILLRENNIAQGFASYGVWKEHSNKWKIAKLYVLPESHGRGLGRKLLEEIIERARNAGMEAVILNVNRYNPAFTFYKKIGFTVLREEDIPIGPYWMNDYVLQLKIK